MTRRVFALLLAIFLSCQGQAKEKPAAILEVLPEKLGALKREKIHTYEQPALGASAPYKRDGMIITVYVYDLGIERIGNSLEDPILQKAFNQAKGDVQTAATKGTYTALELLDDGRAMFGGTKATLRARYHLTRGEKTGDPGLETLSEIHVFGSRQHIVKLRVTGDRELEAEQPKIVQTFVQELMDALRAEKRP